jgi:hypothetical protein
VFRRRRSTDDDQTAEAVDAAVETEVSADDPVTEVSAEAVASVAADRREGPFDESEVDGTAVEHVDFGSLRVPALDGTEIRVEIEEASGQVQAITVVTEDSALQLGVYAAPRKAGIWDEVRTSIASGITTSGGTAGEQDGPLGPELAAKVPVDDGKRKGLQAVRFLGADGPRWFVRGVLTGAAAEDQAAAAPLVTVLKSCVVVRGPEARAPHEPLPLSLPQMEDGEESGGAPSAPNPFKRGPEITEIR